MEEEWKRQEEVDQQTPDFLLVKDTGSFSVKVSEDDHHDLFGDSTNLTSGSQAYEGELNSMTFNLVKSSSAFSKQRHPFDVTLANGDD